MKCNGKIWMRIAVVTVTLIFFLHIRSHASYMTGESQHRNEADLVILFTNDLHSNADYPRLASVISAQRDSALAGECAVVVLDAGDIAMGAIYQTLYPTHAIEYVTMGMLGYDATTFGNHDFDFGLRALEDMFKNAALRSKELGVKLPYFLVSNLNIGKDCCNLNNISSIRDTLTVNKEILYGDSVHHVKIGLFGLMGKDAFSTIIGNDSLCYKKREEAAVRSVTMLKKSGCDYIICLSHGGTSEDGSLAAKVAGIDVIISGHDHDTLHSPLMINKTLVASAGAMGKYLGKIRLGRNEVKSYTLIPISDNVVPNPEISMWMDECMQKVSDHFLASGGVVPEDTIAFVNHSYNLNISPDGNLPLACHIARSYSCKARELTGITTDNLVSIVPYGIIRNPLDSGAVTVHNIYNVLSLGISEDGSPGYPLVMAWLNGEELEDICELNATVAWGMADARLFFDGMKFTFDRRRLPFFRVKEVTVNGEKIDKDSLYPVVTGLYTAKLMGMLSSSSFGLLSVEPKDQAGNKVDDLNRLLLPSSEWLAFTEYIKKNGLENHTEKCSIEDPTHSIYLYYSLLILPLLILTVWRLLFRKL